MILPILKLPSVVEAYCPAFKGIFSDEAYEHFKRYLTGLLLSENKTVEAINGLFVLDKRHQSSLNRFLTRSAYDIEALNDLRLDWLNGDANTSFKVQGDVRGVLALDDSMFEHYGSHFDNITYLYNHAQGYSALAHNVVNLHYVDDKVDYPVNFRLWEPPHLEEIENTLLKAGVKIKEEKLKLKQTQPKKWRQHLMYLYGTKRKKELVEAVYKTKIDLSKSMLKVFFDRHGDIDLPIAFDSWYTVPEFCKYIDETLHKAYVAALKPSDELVLTGSEKIKASDFAKRLQESHKAKLERGERGLFEKTGIKYKGKKEVYFSHCGTHHIKGFGKQRFVVNFKNEDLSDNPKFLISNRLDWHSGGITRIYRHRWHIEVFHEEGKDEGLNKYRLRDFEAIKRHIAMVILAYSYLQRLRFDQTLLNQLHWKPKESETENSLRFWRRVLTYEALVAIINWFAENIYNKGEIQQMMECLKVVYK